MNKEIKDEGMQSTHAFAKMPVMRSCCPSNDFEEGEPSGSCWGDGHYLCQRCKWYRADFKIYGQEYIDGAHNAQAGLQFSILRQ